MRVNVPFEVSEEVRRRLRAGLKRGGVATRKEYRIWVTGVIADAVARLPEPKVRRKPAPPPGPTPAERAPEDASCKRCAKPKENHGKMMLSCPPVSGVPHGGRFTL